MTIFIDAETLADLQSYDGLIRAVGRWLNRPDLEDSAADFIRLAEARFRRVLITPDMETEVTFTPSILTALPADYDSLRSLVITSPVQLPLTPMAPADFYALPSGATGVPRNFLIAGSNIKAWPAPDDTYTALLTYRANLPALSPNIPSNWLLAQHPDAYLYGVLIQAEFYGWNDDRISLIKAALDEVLTEIMADGNNKRYGGGPLVMRPAVNEGLRTHFR